MSVMVRTGMTDWSWNHTVVGSEIEERRFHYEAEEEEYLGLQGVFHFPQGKMPVGYIGIF